MSRKLFLAALAGSMVLSFAAFAQPAKDIGRAPPGSYKLETAHSQVQFSISHMGLTDFHGRFNTLSGTLNLDSNQPERSATTITIQMDSLDTPSPELNSELKGSRVFGAQEFPTATFKSTSIQRTGPNTGKITGDLTLKGVTKPVTLDVTFNGGMRNPIKPVYDVGFTGHTMIKRSDFNLTGMIWSAFVGDDVELTIEAMFEQEKD